VYFNQGQGGEYEWVPMTSMLGVTLIYNGLLKLPSSGGEEIPPLS